MTITQRKNLKTSWENVFALLKKIGGTTTGKKLAKQWGGKIALILAGTAATATPAHALRINPTYSSEIDLQTTQIIENVAAIWEQELKDPVTLNINFSFDPALPTGILGGSKPAMLKVNYRDYLTALGQDGLSNDDILAVQNKLVDIDDKNDYNEYLAGTRERKRFRVKDTKNFDLLIDDTFNVNNGNNTGNGILDDNNNRNNRKIWLTRANAKAIDLLRADDEKLDATVVLSSAVNWDMNPDDGIDANAYDFRTVVLHEIGHALGFVSGSDAMEHMSSNSTGTIDDYNIDFVTPLNTYMYSTESGALGAFDLRSGASIEKYLSIDGGTTAVTNEQGATALFSTGSAAVGGDGYQNSHWKNNLVSPLGIMNPALTMGSSLAISDLDLKMLDLMGWDLVERTRTLMDQTGLDWDAFQLALAANHQTIVDARAAEWALQNPGESIDAELAAELWDLYQDIEGDIEQELLTLKDNLANPGGSGDDDDDDDDDEWDDDDVIPLTPEEQRANTNQAIWDLIYAQDNKLQQFSQEVVDVNTRVPQWLEQETTILANTLQNANRVEVHKLQKKIDNAQETEQEVWEDKLSQAFALFLDNPQEALAHIIQSNDFHSPMDGGSGSSGTGGGWWGGWWSSSLENSEDLDLYNYSRASSTPNEVQPAQSVPEPSTIIALVALGGMGWLTRKSKN
ncbi:MAG: NF038122 family metalloprotease [Crocosphaera sp.]|nr:NF038122 family metalloprotease [Crocosphaera sp.]